MGVKMKKLMNWLKNEESGQGMVEYGLIIALVAVVLIVALSGLSGTIGGIFDSVDTELDAALTD